LGVGGGVEVREGDGNWVMEAWRLKLGQGSLVIGAAYAWSWGLGINLFSVGEIS